MRRRRSRNVEDQGGRRHTRRGSKPVQDRNGLSGWLLAGPRIAALIRRNSKPKITKTQGYRAPGFNSA